jgi:hypothetical protein
MDRKSIPRLTIAALVGTLLVACGGGGGTPQVAGIDGTGITGGETIAIGTVTGFGSVFVNGVRYDTASANFTIDGNPGTQDDLSVGDIVIVRGRLSGSSSTSGTADAIVFDDVVEGPIEAGSIDLLANRFVALGQTVAVTADTSFDDSIQPATLAGLSDGDIVEVSGFRASNGFVQATRIELKPAGQLFEVTGVVSNLDGVAFSFDIEALSVDYSGSLLEDFPAGIVTEGDLVEVKGSVFNPGGALIATRVELKSDDLAGNDGDRVELEGFITRFVDTSDFDVAGAQVTTTAQTIYEGGVAGDLGLDVKVEVEGNLNASGVLVASKVDIRRARAVRAVAVIDAVDAATDSFEILGITVNSDVLTRIEDKSSQDVQPFFVDDLVAGDYVEVRGAELPAGSGEILAALIEREDLDSETELQGFVTADNGSLLTILGVTISTSGSTQYRDENDAPITMNEFFTRVVVGSLVKASGAEVGRMAIAASELEIELD